LTPIFLPWALKIRHTIFHCDHQGGEGYCGINGKPLAGAPLYDDTGFDISIGPGGLHESQPCGCLQAVIIHEVAHMFGYTHSGQHNASDLEKRRFPSCAAP
jgi:hypothetical protein